jgi:hypothetical protein
MRHFSDGLSEGSSDSNSAYHNNNIMSTTINQIVVLVVSVD